MATTVGKLCRPGATLSIFAVVANIAFVTVAVRLTTHS